MVLLGENFSFDDVKHIVMLNGKRRSLKDTHKQGCHFIFLIYLKHFFFAFAQKIFSSCWKNFWWPFLIIYRKIPKFPHNFHIIAPKTQKYPLLLKQFFPSNNQGEQLLFQLITFENFLPKNQEGADTPAPPNDISAHKHFILSVLEFKLTW